MLSLSEENEVLSSKLNKTSLLEAIYNKLPDLVFIFDIRERKFIIRNAVLDHFLGFFELPGNQIDCITLQSLIHPEDWKSVEKALILVHKLTEKDSIEIEYRCKAANQQYQYFQTRLSVFEMQENEVVYLLGISQNITERKKSEQQRELYKNKLQELSFITSHEMRHEYAKIQSIVNLMDNRFITDVERVDLIKEAKKSIQLINSAIFRLNHKLSFNQNDDFFDADRATASFKKVVFIDDDALTNVLNKKILHALLPEMPIDVYLNVDEAISDLKATPSTHELLIFLDINFPGRGGWEFLDEYIGFSEASNVIVLSSSIDNRDREKARSYKSVIDYITKPLSFEFIKTFFEELKTVKYLS